MKLIWDATFERLLEGYSQPVKEKWFARLVRNINFKQRSSEKIKFIVTGIKNSGFEVKAEGLFAFIPFEFMPWKYHYSSFWSAVYPYLLEKTFLCKIYKIETDPFRVRLNAKISQFKKPALLKDEKCRGVILMRSKSGLLVDFGIHFDWQCGSICSFIKKSEFNINIFDRKLSPGRLIESNFMFVNENGSYVFANKNVSSAHINLLSEKYSGKIVEAKVIKQPGIAISFLVDGIHKGILSSPSRRIYFSRNINEIRKAILNLNNDEIIHCEVRRIEADNTFMLKWADDDEISQALSGK